MPQIPAGLVALGLVALGLGGCGSVVDYTLARHADDDCLMLRALVDEPICQLPPPRKPAPELPEAYCYRTLGVVDCYTTPEHARPVIDRG